MVKSTTNSERWAIEKTRSFSGDLVTRFGDCPTDSPEQVKTWSDLVGTIKGLGDFLTASEEDEVEKLAQRGQLPESVNLEAVRRYSRYCHSELLPRINENREKAGLPRLFGKVLDNAIMGDRWIRDRRGVEAWHNNTANRVFPEAERPKMGDWGHLRHKFIEEKASTAAGHLREVLMSGGTTPNVKLVTEYFTYRDKDNVPYGYAYSIRLEQQTVVSGVILQQVISEHADIISEFAYRELPPSVTRGESFKELPEDKQAFYKFLTKKVLEGLGVTASLL